MTKIFCFFIALCSFFSCKPTNSTGFSGSNKVAKSPEPIPSPQIVQRNDGRVTLEFFSRVTQVMQPVDIIFAVDTSGSMAEEKAQLEQNMNRLLSILQSDPRNLDYQIFVIAENFNVMGQNNGKVSLVNSKVGSCHALQELVKFLSGQTRGSLSLRPNSVKEFVAVTDDNADLDPSCTENVGPNQIDANAFIQFYQTNKAAIGTLHMNGFVGLPTSRTTPTCKVENVGTAYIALSQTPELAGSIMSDICTTDWSALLTNFAGNIVKSEGTNIFPLDQVPDTTRPLEVKVNGSVLAPSDYRYDANLRGIALEKRVVPPDAAQISVTFFPRR